MKTLRSKMMAIALCPVIISAILIGMIGFWSVSDIMTTYSEAVLVSIAQEQAAGMERVFENIEHSAQIMQKCVQQEITSVDDLKNPALVKKYEAHAESVLLNLAANTKYADSMYIRFNPKYTAGTAGVFYVRNDDHRHSKQLWEKAPLTDLSNYKNDNSPSLAWWNEPVKKGKATWVTPHVDNVLQVNTLSYCIPIYVDKELLAVVGVDTRLSVLANFLKDVKIFDTGSAFLTNENEYIIYHPEETDPKVKLRIIRDSAAIANALISNPDKEGIIKFVNPDKEDISLADEELSCGLHIIISARQKEIYAEREKLIGQMLVVMLVILMFLVLVVKTFVDQLVAPIHELIQASEKIAQGDIDQVHLKDSKRDDEIGILNNSLKLTTMYLKRYINRVNTLAYKDLMTGVKNRTCYEEAVLDLTFEINNSKPKFSVAVFDVNNLKKVNDTQGHELGDKMIMDACRLICTTFKGSPVYRIGGDEFVVISEGADYENREALLDSFKAKIKAQKTVNKEYELVVACGMSAYRETDIHFEDIFQRADKAMYENKLALKQQSESVVLPTVLCHA